MAHIFNGEQKRIYIDSALPEVSVRELYSEWKEWVRISDNLKFQPAFRNFGGDPTIEGQTAPAYYFMTNGWRCVVDGFDATFAFNLYTDEGDSAVITLNNGTAQISNSDVGIINSSIDYNQLASQIADALGTNLNVTVDSASIAEAVTSDIESSPIVAKTSDLQSIHNSISQITGSNQDYTPQLTALQTSVDNIPTSSIDYSTQLADLQASLDAIPTASGDDSSQISVLQDSVETNHSSSMEIATTLAAMELQLQELYLIHGLDPLSPLVVNQSLRTAGEVTQSIFTTGEGPTQETTITRNE